MTAFSAAVAVVGTAQHLGADTARGDQSGAEPLADAPLEAQIPRGDASDGVAVVTGECLAHVAEARQVLGVDAEVVRGHGIPQPPADHLELDRLHEAPGLLGEAPVRTLDLGSGEVGEQGLGSALAEGAPAKRRRAGEHLVHGLAPEQLQSEGVAPAGGDEVHIGLHLGQELLAQGEQGPQAGVAQGITQGLEEDPLGLGVERVDREDLLELVEHQEDAGCARLALDVQSPAEIVAEGLGRDGCHRTALVTGQAFLEAQHQAGQEPVAGARSGSAVPWPIWGRSRLTRIGGQTLKPSRLSLGTRLAQMSEVLPAPEGEWSQTMRSAESR